MIVKVRLIRQSINILSVLVLELTTTHYAVCAVMYLQFAVYCVCTGCRVCWQLCIMQCVQFAVWQTEQLPILQCVHLYSRLQSVSQKERTPSTIQSKTTLSITNLAESLTSVILDGQTRLVMNCTLIKVKVALIDLQEKLIT